MKSRLETILKSMQTSEDAKPSASFVKNARIRVLNQVDTKASMVAPVIGRSVGIMMFRLALVFVLAILFIGGGVVYTAGFSAPGDALYPVKVAFDRMTNTSPRESAAETPQQATTTASIATPSPSLPEGIGGAPPAGQSGVFFEPMLIPDPTGTVVPTENTVRDVLEVTVPDTVNKLIPTGVPKIFP